MLLLASTSETRASLLRQAGLAFTVIAPDFDEAAAKPGLRRAGLSAGQAALALARGKAGSIRAPGGWVIGADQILEHQGVWFDKPGDPAEARAHLRRLRGSAHRLHTACVVWRDGRETWQYIATATLDMRAFSDAFLEAYLAAEAVWALRCVGAYRLEGPGVQLMDRVRGDHAAILGLPILPLLRFLRRQGALPG